MRSAALEGLAGFGPEAKEAVPVFIEATKDDGLRAAATLALSKMGAEAKPAVKALAACLSDANPVVRDNCLTALGKLGKDAKDAVPEMAKLLEIKEVKLRIQILAALGQLGKEAKAAVPQMIQVLEERSKELHAKAVEAIAQVGKDAVRPLAEALTRNASPYVRLGAAKALGAIGPDARIARPGLLMAQRDPVVEVRQAATEAYQKVIAKKR